MPNKTTFDVIFDSAVAKIDIADEIAPNGRKFTITFANDFQDGKWRDTKFSNYIWDNVAETSLSKRERDSLIDQSRLVEAAKKLRFVSNDESDFGRGSEIAEILLYGLMKEHYAALPVVPKIFYKQNSQDYAKGADSVHLVLEPNNDFSIWFGEAKFYDNIEDTRLTKIIQSVKDSLTTKKLSKENSIITNISDIHDLKIDPVVRNRILEILSPKESIDSMKPKLHVPILLLHQCELTRKTKALTPEYKDRLIEHHKERTIAYFKKQLSKVKKDIHLYEEITFHLILFPVPNKEAILKKFKKNLDHYQSQ